MKAPEAITPNLLREWPVPAAGESKYSRGQVVVVGGARRSPGAAMLAGRAALRAGAGRLTLAVADSVATAVAVALPETGIVPLRETAEGYVDGESLEIARRDLEGADAVLVGPGLDDAEQAAVLLRHLPDLVSPDALIILDAFALGVLRDETDVFHAFRDRLILTPNPSEAQRLIGRETEIGVDEVAEIAEHFEAVVSCQGLVCDNSGRRWKSGTGTVGLGTSGSGDILAGVVAGLCARGATPAQAAVWAMHLHGEAGDRLSGRVGYLATELGEEIPRVMGELG
jgi:ADP-dependent NAD(P)H-hydrate dehydratase